MDENREQDAFERLLFATLIRETTAVRGECTHAETFIASLAGELTESEEDLLTAHLLVCPACAREYASIARSLQQEQELLSEEARVPSLAAQVQRKREEEQRGWRHGWHVLSSLLPPKEHRLRGAIEVAAVGLIITLSVILPLHYLAEKSPAIIPTDGQMVAKGDALIETGVNAPSELTPSALVEKLDSMAGYEQWRAAAFVIGYLRSAGVPLGSGALSFERQTTYTTQVNDTWRMVAEKAVGDWNLWPIIILLNHDRTDHGEFPPAGTILRVPEARE